MESEFGNIESRLSYGWENGELRLEKIPLSPEDEQILKKLTDVSFKEMGERTRTGAGDDQFYVDVMYDKLKKNTDMEILVRVVFLLTRQLQEKKI